MADSISNSDQVIDTRDVEERIDELRDELMDKFKETWVPKHPSFLEYVLEAVKLPGHIYHEEAVRYHELSGRWPNSLTPEESADLVTVTEQLREDWESEKPDEPSDEEFKEWLEEISGNPSADLSEEATEYRALVDLKGEAEGYCEWRDGSTLVHRDHWIEYVKEFANDIGAVSRGAKWPNNHIDWDSAAQELEQDYTSVDFDCQEYLVRTS